MSRSARQRGAVLVAGMALCCALSCAGSERPALALEGVEPDRGPAGQAVAVQITGTFPLDVQISYRDPGQTLVRTGFSALLGERPLNDVGFVDAGHLSARVPADLDVGVHDLLVEGPDGQQASLPQAFSVEGVVTCTQDGDCVDSCHSAATCSNGACVLGAADLDQDSDGHVDVGCPDGDDCDDSRAGCALDCTDADGDDHCADQDCDDSSATGADCYQGCATFFLDQDGDGAGLDADTVAACRRPTGYADVGGDCADTPGSDPACAGRDGALCAPGNVEQCDGADSDCDPATVDGSGAAGFGDACGGLDDAACGAGSLACDGVALFCSGVAACHADASCVDLGSASYACQCDPGFTGDGLSCAPVAQDCSTTPSLCDANASCVDQGGGEWQCVCNSGFVGDGASCTPDAGCALTCDANASCLLVQGAYSCLCDRGFGGDGLSCTANQGGVAIARARDVTAQTAVDLILQEPLNLFTADGAQPETLADWTILQNLGDGWLASSDPDIYPGPGPFGETCYIMSYDMDRRSRELDLLALGYSAAELDASPPLAVREWVVGAWPNYSDFYYVLIELRDASHAAIDTYRHGRYQQQNQLILATDAWQREGAAFSGYRSGLRYIYIEDGGYDAEYWADWYGAKASGALAVFGSFEMRLSSDGQAWGAWEPFAPERAWTLEARRGVQRVWVEFRDAGDQSFLGAAEDWVLVDCTDTCDPNASCRESAGVFSCVCDAGYTGDGLTCTPS